MKRTILATCLAGACAVTLSAQTPTQQPPTGTAGTAGATTESQDTQRSRGGPMTITGCLKEGDTAGTFVLTNIKGMGRPGGAAGTTAGDTTGAGSTTGGATTTAPQGGARGMNQVALMASGDVDLKSHLNHQVEVTGTPGRGAGATAGGTTGGDTTGGGTAAGGTTGGGATTGATSTSGQTGRARSINVTNVRMISASCSSQQ